MNPNGIALGRAFAREADAMIAAEILPITDSFEVVVEAKAGSTIHGYGQCFLPVLS